MDARQAESLPVPYFHVVFTLPVPAAEIAFQNKRAVSAPVLAYLGRYSHRVAIANSHLTRLHLKRLPPRRQTKVMTLTAGEFIRQFLLHTVPDGFHRVRHIGCLASRHRTENLALCRTPPQSYRERYRQLTGEDLDVCPDCGGQMRQRGLFAAPSANAQRILVRQFMTMKRLADRRLVPAARWNPDPLIGMTLRGQPDGKPCCIGRSRVIKAVLHAHRHRPSRSTDGNQRHSRPFEPLAARSQTRLCSFNTHSVRGPRFSSIRLQ